MLSASSSDDSPAAPVPTGGAMDVNQALQAVLKTALIHDGVVHGLHEAAKALDKRQAVLCLLAENCDEPMYKKLVQALCSEHQIPLIKVDNNKKLGEWTGLCKFDSTGKARKIVGCSCVVIRVRNQSFPFKFNSTLNAYISFQDYGEESPALDALKDYLKSAK